MTTASLSNRLTGPDFTLPADGWYQVVPRGEFGLVLNPKDPGDAATLAALTRRGVTPERLGNGRMRVLQVIDDTSTASILSMFKADAAAPAFPGLLIDHEHFSEDPDKDTAAGGWIMDLQNRPDGVYCLPRWTDPELITSGRKRFLSPAFDPADVEPAGGARVRPLRLDYAALTNRPNMRTIKPLSNRAPDGETAPADSGKSPGNTGGKESTMDYKAELLALLGLPAESTDEDIAGAVSARKTELANSKAAAAERDTLKNRVAELEKADLERQVEADLAKYGDRIKNRDAVKARLLADRAGTLAVLEALPTAEDTAKLHNRRDTKTPADRKGVDDRAAAQQECLGKIRNRLRGEGKPSDWQRCWDLALAENPDLFKEPKAE